MRQSRCENCVGQSVTAASRVLAGPDFLLGSKHAKEPRVYPLIISRRAGSRWRWNTPMSRFPPRGEGGASFSAGATLFISVLIDHTFQVRGRHYALYSVQARRDCPGCRRTLFDVSGFQGETIRVYTHSLVFLRHCLASISRLRFRLRRLCFTRDSYFSYTAKTRVSCVVRWFVVTDEFGLL